VRDQDRPFSEMVDRLTASEMKVRDRAVSFLVCRFIPRWVHPNHITLLRLAMVLISAGLQLAGPSPLLQAELLIGAALTDSLDGTLARRRGLTSQLGRTLDQVTDWCLGGWMGILCLIHGVLPPYLIALMVAPELANAALQRVRAARLPAGRRLTRVVMIALGPANFPVSAVSRFQFVLVLSGFSSLLLARSLGRRFLFHLGFALLYLEVFCSWLVFCEGVQAVRALGPGAKRRGKEMGGMGTHR